MTYKTKLFVWFYLFYFSLIIFYFSFSIIEIRPISRKGTPVTVEFSIFVVDINSINVEDMDFRWVYTLFKK